MKRCEGCTRTTTVTLHDGRTVCTYCPEWMLETEAKHLLTMRLDKRREALSARVTKRGEESVNILKARMAAIHAQNKKPIGSSTKS